MGLHMSSDKYPVGKTTVPSSDPTWNYNDPEHIWERDHFLISVKDTKKGARKWYEGTKQPIKQLREQHYSTMT